MVIFLAGMERTDSYYGCITVAALMHYFLLVSFMWMLVEGFLQYLRFVRVLGTYVPRFILKASIPAWGRSNICPIIKRNYQKWNSSNMNWYYSIGCKILLIFQILFQCFLLENVNSYVKVSFWIFFTLLNWSLILYRITLDPRCQCFGSWLWFI